MENLICKDCNTQTEVIYDHTTGDTVCSECGLVLDSHYIDATSEWRNFADSLDDPSRVGGASDPLLNSQTLTTNITVIKKKGGKNTSTSSAAAANNAETLPMFLENKKSSKPDRLLSAMRIISSMADRLSLVDSIVDRANEIFKKVIIDTKTSSWKGKKHSDAMCAACLFVACQMERVPRTLKEVCSAVEEGVTKKDVGKAKQFITQHYLNNGDDERINNNNNMIMNCGGGKKNSARAAVFVRRFCSNLGGVMDNRSVKAAIEAAQKSEEEFDVRRSPVSLAAAVIYVVSRLLEEKKRPALREIAVVTGVAEGTIKNVCKDIRPHVGKIVPSWFASEDQLKILGNL